MKWQGKRAKHANKYQDKKLQLKALVDSGCTHTGINKQLVKNKQE